MEENFEVANERLDFDQENLVIIKNDYKNFISEVLNNNPDDDLQQKDLGPLNFLVKIDKFVKNKAQTFDCYDLKKNILNEFKDLDFKEDENTEIKLPVSTKIEKKSKISAPTLSRLDDFIDLKDLDMKDIKPIPNKVSKPSDKENTQNDETKPNSSVPVHIIPGFVYDVTKRKNVVFPEDKSKNPESKIPAKKKNPSSKHYTQFEDEEKESNEDLVKLSILKRKKMRIFYLILNILMISIGLGVGFSVLNSRGTENIDPNSDFYLSISDCQLEIIDSFSGQESPVVLSYKIPNKFDLDSEIFFVENLSQSGQNFSFVNPYPEAKCNIKLSVAKNAILSSINIDCPTSCSIIQDSEDFAVSKELKITGDKISANFKDITTPLIEYKAISGNLQINSILLNSSNPSRIEISNEGDVLFQSTSSFQISGSLSSQAFCYSSPFIAQQPDTANCAISEDSSTDIFRDSTLCTAVYNLCTISGCSPDSFISISVGNGSIYANLIPSKNSILTGTSAIAKGQIFDLGINFTQKTFSAFSEFNSNLQDDSKNSPLLIFDLGDYEIKSSFYAKYIISSNPSYSYMKPWWLSSFSGSLLRPYVTVINSNLLPGFCPFISQLTTDKYYLIQEAIRKHVSGPDTLITVIKDRSEHVIDTPTDQNGGFYSFSKSRNPIGDLWYSVQILENGLYYLLDNDISRSPSVVVAIIFSLLVTFVGGFFIMEIVVYACMEMYYKVVGQTQHLQKYTNILEKSKNRSSISEKKNAKENKKEFIKKFNLAALLRSSPSVSAYLDYLAHLVYKQLVDSTDLFFKLLFEKVSASDDLEELDPNNDMIKGEEIKVLYERFCFVNHFVEQKLTDPVNKKKLKKLGFMITEDANSKVLVLTKINLKNFNDFPLQAPQEKDEDSLDSYFKANVQITAFEDDVIEMETFINLYNSFCDFNRLEKVLINASLMEKRFEIISQEINVQIIQRDPDFIEKPNFIKGYFKFSDKSKYIINRNRVEDNIALFTQQTENLSIKRLNESFKLSILFPYWWAWDWLVVLIHCVFCAAITIPIFLVALLIEVEYSQYSMKDPDVLVNYNDILRDPGSLYQKMINGFGWTTALLIILIIHWVLSFIDLIIYYW